MYQDITPQELQALQQSGAQVIDVREDWEYGSGHIPGARNIPLGTLPDQASTLQGPLVVVCGSGGRSAQAAQYLAANGVGKVANLLGGTAGWIRSGLTIE
ncbi:rhodanese-like domain-containing protein [Deinococcus alpinitundrae]|uniref:rhodanese-like domain-containing protein n=1 Tax=Deinococcus alpinitundrae TaxID=468913 RepID=UPI00137B7825|nr:rhodanese-like domain-containing protein [Deinococcus alpinitundrae]